MKVLVINCGSSSIKYSLYDMSNEAVLAHGMVERIGEKQSMFRHKADGRERKGECAAPDHDRAFDVLAKNLLDPEKPVIGSVGEIAAVGHRVVHGAEDFVESMRIDAKVIAQIEACAELAPLHNPPNLTGIRAAQRVFPAAAHVAVFDTAFHQTMPDYAYTYAIPYEYYEKHRIRRYGFHGTSHRFVSMEAARFLGRPYESLNQITAHLGNGCSITAVRRGKAVDNSMGLTPLEGLVMGTRSGDIDPALVAYIGELKGIDAAGVTAILNKKSGLVGVSGTSNDMRTLETEAASGSRRAMLAMQIFAYRVRKYIGAYLAVLDGADTIVFTGGIGENAVGMREMILKDMGRIGVVLDAKRNNEAIGRKAVISADDSPVVVLTIPTNEELLIARDTALIVAAR
ncbi:MAG TPA: acetate kinase [Candidatus Brocadiia bacterium]|nr:acetate kinase [Candidatus Brocadiia bacterium]